MNKCTAIMNKIVEYVNTTDIDGIVVAIRQREDLNVHKVIDDLKKSRTEYGLKVQVIIEELLNGYT